MDGRKKRARKAKTQVAIDDLSQKTGIFTIFSTRISSKAHFYCLERA
jgi:hypothetical protein